MPPAAEEWSGDGMSQMDFMKKDECILLDEKDTVTGSANKYDAHVFSAETPTGLLHRAFSVFLFDSKGRLLLQQRAKSKITFPLVWTNTCCSHPLHGYNPTEVDGPADVKNGTTPGAKRAAVRKLKHELGIEPEEVPESKFKFLTRLHYWAADTITHGPTAQWGEHEIDYVLFIQADVTVNPNKEEVEDYKYVTMKELAEMMDEKKNPDLLWSPWFKLITKELLLGKGWWKDLKGALTSNKFVDTKTIYKFGPPYPEFKGGLQHQGFYKPSTVGKAVAAKQGAYGKLKTHGESKVKQLLRLDEVFNAVWFKTVGGLAGRVDPLMLGAHLKDDVLFCDKMLGKVSRSFAAVIRQLPSKLVLDVLVFYLVLRGLDTIEDDMECFDSTEQKLYYLKDFYTTALQNPFKVGGWKMFGVGEGDEALLLEQFYKVSNVFQALPKASQDVIADINVKMGEGMAYFIGKDMGQGTENTKEYDLYCHYVAGLVGEGLSRLFVAAGYEQEVVAKDLYTSNAMGLFLQKTNIIRDYLEDYVDGRAWWPQDVWKKHCVEDPKDLGEFSKQTPGGYLLVRDGAGARACLNELVTDALTLVPDCLVYLRRLENPAVFRFCAIPQVMAIATLDKCFNNEDVFTGVVKVRKGLAVSMILDSADLDGVEKWFRSFATTIKTKADPADPCYAKTLKACDKVLSLTKDRRPLLLRRPALFPLACCIVAYVARYKAALLRGVLAHATNGATMLPGRQNPDLLATYAKVVASSASAVAHTLATTESAADAGTLVAFLASCLFVAAYVLVGLFYAPKAAPLAEKKNK